VPEPTPHPDHRPHQVYGASVVRSLAWRLAWPMALVALLLFGLLAWETTRLLPAGDPGLAAALWRIGLLLGAALVLVFSAGWLVARRAVQPVARLTAAIERLGRGEEVQLEVQRGEVIGRLQRGVNEASQALARSRNRMQSELGRASVELADRNARLEAASQSRSRFLAAASHDLRQPLYALTLFSSAMRAGETDPAKLVRVSRIEECVASLDHLFSELLDLSRLEAGVMQATIGAVRLDEVFDEVSRNFRILAESRGLRLIVRKTDAWVSTDRTMLARILNNLVSNALRYTESGGVLVGVRHRGDGQVRVDVWDTGSGIAPEHQQQVFEEFYQVADARHGSHGERQRGLGLGLATVRRLAGLLGCTLALASRPGRGTRVSLQLPRAAAPGAHPAAGDAEMPLDVSGLRVLVVDDEASILEGLSALLAEWGCSVLAAEGEQEALAQLDAWPEPPDLVVTDLRLREGRSGLDVLRSVARHYRRDPQQPGFARLLVTGETRRDRLGEIAASRVPVLFKPVSPQKLREAMLASVFVARADPGDAA
jgi:signal transduction histidine kinase